ncbi:hypothetical protein SUGI_0780730 [Cryptomeria japonica]|nr:hypothetical protein SUGI_0780730 [Cryptomeria japonica]
MEILLSKHCPLWNGLGSNRLKWLQRIAYINIVVYPLNSIPLIIYSFLPAICLLTGKIIIPPLDNIGIMWVTAVLVSTVSSLLLELEWGSVEIEEWWTTQQLWVIGGISSHLFAIFQALLKVYADIEITTTRAHGKVSLKSDKAEDS